MSIDTCYLYCLAIKTLLKNGDAQQTYNYVKEQAKKFDGVQYSSSGKNGIDSWF